MELGLDLRHRGIDARPHVHLGPEVPGLAADRLIFRAIQSYLRACAFVASTRTHVEFGVAHDLDHNVDVFFPGQVYHASSSHPRFFDHQILL